MVRFLFGRNIPFVGVLVRITRESAHWSVSYEERLTVPGEPFMT